MKKLKCQLFVGISLSLISVVIAGSVYFWKKSFYMHSSIQPDMGKISPLWVNVSNVSFAKSYAPVDRKIFWGNSMNPRENLKIFYFLQETRPLKFEGCLIYFGSLLLEKVKMVSAFQPIWFFVRIKATSWNAKDYRCREQHSAKWTAFRSSFLLSIKII